jgi:hypothetical protein
MQKLRQLKVQKGKEKFLRKTSQSEDNPNRKKIVKR